MLKVMLQYSQEGVVCERKAYQVCVCPPNVNDLSNSAEKIQQKNDIGDYSRRDPKSAFVSSLVRCHGDQFDTKKTKRH